MDGNRVKYVAELSRRKPRCGLLELWDGVSQIVWYNWLCGVSIQWQFGAESVQRLREWCYGADEKKGEKRRELDVSTCFGPLLDGLAGGLLMSRDGAGLDATT